MTRGQSAAADGARHLKKSDGLLRPSQHLRYPFLHRERQMDPVRLLCAVLQVSSRGYYRFVKRGGGRAQPNPALICQVQRLHRASRGTYGSRRLWQALQQAGYAMGRYRTQTLMRQAKLKPRRTWRCQQTTDSRQALPIAPNVLNRRFTVAAPNLVWGSNITALRTLEGWLYMVIVADLFSRKVVGWACAASMATCVITSAWQMAIGQRQPKPGLLHHSERGSQYASAEYQGQLRDAKMMSRRSRKGNCYDNAIVERVFCRLQEEGFTDHPPETRADATLSVMDSLAMFYHSQRRHSPLGYQSPNALESQAAEQNQGEPQVWTKRRSAREGQI